MTEASSYLASESYFSDVMRIGELSLLGQFQRDLFTRYGIYALSETEETYEERLLLQMEASFVKLTGADRMQISVEDLQFDGSPFALSRTDLVRDNVVRKAKADLPYSILGAEALFGDANARRTEEATAPLRTLRNSAEIALLPSHLREERGLSFDGISGLDLGGIVESAGDEAFVNLYIRTCFGTNRTRGNGESFFRNEIEYILAGKMSDEANLSAVKTYLAALRTPLNAAYLYTSPLRREEASSLALLLSGPNAVWSEQAILAIWNVAETAMDVSRLLKGERVPIRKTDETWALSVENLLSHLLQSGDTEDAEVLPEGVPEKETGLTYDDYLVLLLFFEEAETKLLRMMDLIQLNLMMTSQSSFRFATSFGGFSLSARWRQRTNSFLPEALRMHSYEKERTYFDAM